MSFPTALLATCKLILQEALPVIQKRILEHGLALSQIFPLENDGACLHAGEHVTAILLAIKRLGFLGEMELKEEVSVEDRSCRSEVGSELTSTYRP